MTGIMPMIPVGKLTLSAFAVLGVYAAWRLLRFTYYQIKSPLRHLRGPKSSSWLYGNFIDTRNGHTPELFESWVREHGKVQRLKTFLNTNQLFTIDTRAMNHILTHSNDYQKPPGSRYFLGQIFGEGLLVVEAAQHRQQRRIMNPAFGPGQIRALTDIFFAKAVRLRDAWFSEMAKTSAAGTPTAQIDIVSWLNKMTLDVIGLAGFNYNFDALNSEGKPNELNEAFTTMFSAFQGLSIMAILQNWFPVFRLIPTDRTRKTHNSKRTVTRVGKELLANAKETARASASEKGKIEKNSLEGRDLLTLLVKANMATDIPENQRLSDEDVLAQVSTFLIAGHETTSMGVTWALFALTQAPEVQVKLREELLSVDTETPSPDDLLALPYLDIVVRETLRLHAPVPGTGRIATKDDVLPVEKPFIDRYGVVHDGIKISKGDPVFIPILAMNTSQELWGPDAHEFKPERWNNLPEAVSHVPGVWGHMLTFIGGPRACIGYRFSLMEMKAILFVLVRAFEFELAVPVSDVGRKSAVVQRPVLHSDASSKAQLPMLIKPYITKM